MAGLVLLHQKSVNIAFEVRLLKTSHRIESRSLCMDAVLSLSKQISARDLK